VDDASLTATPRGDGASVCPGAPRYSALPGFRALTRLVSRTNIGTDEQVVAASCDVSEGEENRDKVSKAVQLLYMHMVLG
jgi:hypothetical protein